MKKWAAALATCACVSQSALAAYTVQIKEEHGNVVATGSGSINLAGLTMHSNAGTFNPRVHGADARIELGGSTSSTGTVESYRLVNGPSNFGSGANTSPTLVSGEMIGINGTLQRVRVPQAYESGGDLGVSTAEWHGVTFGDLGLVEGTYTWRWGTGLNADSFTVVIGRGLPPPPVAVPTLGALGSLTTAMLLAVGAFVRLRRKP